MQEQAVICLVSMLICNTNGAHSAVDVVAADMVAES